MNNKNKSLFLALSFISTLKGVSEWFSLSLYPAQDLKFGLLFKGVNSYQTGNL